MKQMYVPEPGVIKYREVPDPIPGRRDVVISVKRVGICGSDVHVFKGRHPLVTFPVVQGHEISGEVIKVGSMVTDISKGELVTIMPAIAPANSKERLMGIPARSEQLQFIGGNLPGAGSEHFKVEADCVVPMRITKDPDDVAMVEPLAVAVHSVRMADSAVADETVVVFGAGTIGLLTGMIVRNHGAREVVIVDKNMFRLHIAKEIGLKPFNLQSHKDVKEINLILDEAPSVVFECAGNEDALNAGIHIVRRGGTLVVVGVYESQPVTEMVLVQDKELRLLGSLMYSWGDFLEASKLVDSGRYPLSLLRTHTVLFDNWSEGFRLLIEEPENTIKVMVAF